MHLPTVAFYAKKKGYEYMALASFIHTKGSILYKGDF